MNDENFLVLISNNNNKNGSGNTGKRSRGLTWAAVGIIVLIMLSIALGAAALVISIRRRNDSEEDDRPLFELPPPGDIPATSPDIPDSEFVVQSGPVGSFPNPLDEYKNYYHPDWVGFIEHPFQPQTYPVSTMHVLRLRKTNQLIGIVFQDAAPATLKYGTDLTLHTMREIYRATKDKLNTFHRLTSGPCMVYYLRDSKALGEAEMNYSPRSSWLGTGHSPGSQTHLHEFGHNIFHFVSRDTGRNRGANGDDDMTDWVENIRKNKTTWRANRIYDWCMNEFFYECEETRPGEHFAGAVSGFFCRRQRDLMRTYDPLNFNILSKYFYERDITTSCPK
jgi:hypothetical protein